MTAMTNGVCPAERDAPPDDLLAAVTLAFDLVDYGHDPAAPGRNAPKVQVGSKQNWKVNRAALRFFLQRRQFNGR